jgi:hypothetical protein
MKTDNYLFLIIVALSRPNLAGAEDAILKPYILASSMPGTIDKKLADVKAALGQQGLQVVGEYSPYKGAHVIVVSSDALKKSAAKSDFGAYGAIQRIALTEAGLTCRYPIQTHCIWPDLSPDRLSF